MVLHEQRIERYKYLYSLANKHKKSRNEILELISNEYHFLKKTLNDSKIFYNDTEFNKIILNSSNSIRENFSNENLIKEFEFIPKIHEKGNENSKSLIERNGTIQNYKPNFLEEFLLAIGQMSRIYVDHINAIKNQKKTHIEYRVNYLAELYDCLSKFGLHEGVYTRKSFLYCMMIHAKSQKFIVWNVDYIFLHRNYIAMYSNSKNQILHNGVYFRIEDIEKSYIVSHGFQDNEIPLFCESKGFLFDNTNEKKEKFILWFPNKADELLPREIVDFSLDEDILNAAIGLKDLLIVGKSSKRERNNEYKYYRQVIQNHPEAWNLVSPFIKNFHSYDEFMGSKENVVGFKSFISSEFKSLIETFELRKQSVINELVKKSLLKFENEEQIRKYWEKSLQNIVLDPEEAISRSKTLLETIFKQILDSAKINYNTYKDDFNKLYKLVTKHLKLSPGGEYEQIFNQILNGCQSVVEGVNAARGKLGSSHGKSNAQLKNLPVSRHAELIVNLSGTMATFLIKTWKGF